MSVKLEQQCIRPKYRFIRRMFSYLNVPNRGGIFLSVAHDAQHGVAQQENADDEVNKTHPGVKLRVVIPHHHAAGDAAGNVYASVKHSHYLSSST